MIDDEIGTIKCLTCAMQYMEQCRNEVIEIEKHYASLTNPHSSWNEIISAIGRFKSWDTHEVSGISTSCIGSGKTARIGVIQRFILTWWKYPPIT